MRVEDSLKDKNMAPAFKRKAMFFYMPEANYFCLLQNKRQCPTTKSYAVPIFTVKES